MEKLFVSCQLITDLDITEFDFYLGDSIFNCCRGLGQAMETLVSLGCFFAMTTKDPIILDLSTETSPSSISFDATDIKSMFASLPSLIYTGYISSSYIFSVLL